MALPGGAFSDLQVDVPAALLPRSPLPEYPAALRMLRLDGHARLRFVVDARGRVELATVEVVETSHPAFAAAVRAALPRMRFRPARIGPRGVRQLVEFPITFRLDP
jgi:protein TonB